MSDLPEKIVRFDAVKIEYGKRKMCQCYSPHYEIDYQNKLVYCLDCGAIVDPLEALMRIAKNTKRWDDYTQELLEQRRQIMSYQPRRGSHQESGEAICDRRPPQSGADLSQMWSAI